MKKPIHFVSLTQSMSLCSRHYPPNPWLDHAFKKKVSFHRNESLCQITMICTRNFQL